MIMYQEIKNEKQKGWLTTVPFAFHNTFSINILTNSGSN